eukprot:5996634-Pleurochrysis_carterae.AAC.1
MVDACHVINSSDKDIDGLSPAFSGDESTMCDEDVEQCMSERDVESVHSSGEENWRRRQGPRLLEGAMASMQTTTQTMIGPAVHRRKAAQGWSCPCTDRNSCLSADRLKGQHIYDLKKDFQLSASGKGGKRDYMRAF